MSAKTFLSVCAMFRDEARYLDEWLTFHSYQGVERFFLYDDGSSDNYREVLDPWIAAGRVVLFDGKGRRQLPIFADCLRRVRLRTEWLAYIDVDEFLWSPTGNFVSEVLGRYRGSAGVMVRWVLFGSSGHNIRPEGPIIENYTRCIPVEAGSDDENLFRLGYSQDGGTNLTGRSLQGKSIINPLRVLRVGVHIPRLFLGPLVDENNLLASARDRKSASARRQMWDRNPAEILRINHYWSRSLDELEAKVKRKFEGSLELMRSLDFTLKLKPYLEREAQMNVSTDTSIQPIWRQASAHRDEFLTSRSYSADQ